jgi:membrane fusion protein (multidrug efflux system)
MDVPVVGEWIGTLDGSVNADIRPKIEGYLLRQFYKEGQFVHRNDPLFEIDPRQFRAALEQARGTLARAEAQLSKATNDVERFTPLAAQRAISQQELDNAIAAERDARGGWPRRARPSTSPPSTSDGRGLLRPSTALPASRRPRSGTSSTRRR